MRHAFRFPYSVQIAVRRHVMDAIEKVAPERFSQEQAYTIALMAILQGRVYDDVDGFVEFKVTINLSG